MDQFQSLSDVAAALGDLRHEVVFVGGAVAPLLVTDPGSVSIRPTDDIDLAVELTSRRAFSDLEDALRARGFRNDAREGAPICRWLYRGVPVDVMPTDPEILGFSNRWYPYALETAAWSALPRGGQARIATAVAFAATKIEAFRSPSRRHVGDYVVSHDMEDLITVLDGRPEIDEEISHAREDVRAYLAAAFAGFLKEPAFLESLEGHLDPGPTRVVRARMLIERLGSLATL